MANTNTSSCYRAFGGQLAMPTDLLVADMLQKPNCISGIHEKIFRYINCLQEKPDNSQAVASARYVDNLCVDMRRKWSISTDVISNKSLYISQLQVFLWVEGVIKKRFALLFDKMSNCCIFISYKRERQ